MFLVIENHVKERIKKVVTYILKDLKAAEATYATCVQKHYFRFQNKNQLRYEGVLVFPF